MRYVVLTASGPRLDNDRWYAQMRSRRSIWFFALLPAIAACPIGDLTSERDAAIDVSTESSPGEASTPDAPANDVTTDVITDVTEEVSPKPIAFVQAMGVPYGSGGIALTQNVVDGDSVIVVVDNNSAAANFPVTDGSNNTYQCVVQPFLTTEGSDWVSVFVSFNVKGGFDIVHVALPDGGAGYIMYAAEYSGISAFDVAATGSTMSTVKDALMTSPAVSVTNVPALLFAYAEALNDIGSPGSNFNMRNSYDGNLIEDRIVTTSAQYRATATNAGGSSDIVLAVFH